MLDPFATLKNWLLILAAVVILALSASTWTYHALYEAKAEAFDGKANELAALEGKVRDLNDEAARKLEALTVERDEKQARLNQQAADQETKDAKAKTEIARLDSELRNRPIRVRYVQAPAATGGSGGGTAGEAAGAAVAGAGGQAAATGVLPDENSRRLAIAINEIELLSAAYNSLYSRYVPTQPSTTPPGT